MNLNHSQKVIPFSFNYNKKESNLKRRNYSCRFNINHLHESSCERHKCWAANQSKDNYNINYIDSDKKK